MHYFFGRGSEFKRFLAAIRVSLRIDAAREMDRIAVLRELPLARLAVEFLVVGAALFVSVARTSGADPAAARTEEHHEKK
jgi:hypothetical protein